MPSSLFAYAVDYNGDGHKDIWTTRPDAWASAANYLASSGWHGSERWGRQVSFASHFDRRLLEANAKFPLSEWARLGLRDVNGGPLPTDDGNIRASLVRPDGANGKIYLAYNNFDTVMKWNRSKYFALSVGMLADKIAEARPGGSSRPAASGHLNE